MTTISERMQLRRGTAAQWTSANPVLASGEEGLETDTGKRKIGDGTTTWTALPYNGIGPQGPQGFQGTAGTNGSNGSQGSQGFQGAQGAQGAQGFQGVAGGGGGSSTTPGLYTPAGATPTAGSVLFDCETTTGWTVSGGLTPTVVVSPGPLLATATAGGTSSNTITVDSTASLSVGQVIDIWKSDLSVSNATARTITAISGLNVTFNGAAVTWSNSAQILDPATSALKTTGSHSVRLELSAVTTGKGYVDLAADRTVGSYKYVLVDLAWDQFGITMNLSDTYRLYISDTTGLGGNTSIINIPPFSQDSFMTLAVPIGTLTKVRSIGFVGDAGLTNAGSNAQKFNIYVDNIRFQALDEIDAALATANAVIIPASYTPTIAQEVQLPAPTDLLIDGRQPWIHRLGGIRHLREWQVDETGATDTTDVISRAIDSLSAGETLQFPKRKIFKTDTILQIRRNDITVDFNNSMLVTTLFRGGNNNIEDPMIRISGSHQTLKNLTLVGNHTRSTLGNVLQVATGSPGTSGTAATLLAQGDSVRAKNNDNGITPFYARVTRPQMTIPHQALVNAADPLFWFGSAFVYTLSDSNQVASDCIIEAVPDERPTLTSLTSAVAIGDTTITVTSTAGFVPGDLIMIGTELAGVSDINSPTIITLTNRRHGVTHVSGEPVAVVLAARVLTLTATPTDYMLTWTPDDLRRVARIRVRKLTSTANTITVANLFEYGYVQYVSTHDSASGIRVENTHLTVENFTGEGLPDDALETIRGNFEPANIKITGLLSRCNSRQGISFNSQRYVLLDGFEIISCGRTGIDVEPFSIINRVQDLCIRNGRIYNATNYFISCNNWSRISDLTIENVHCFGSRVGGFLGGSGFRGRISNVTFMRNYSYYGNVGSDALNVSGIDMVVSDFCVDDNVVVGSSLSSFALTGRLAEMTINPHGATSFTVNDSSGLTVGMSIDVIDPSTTAINITTTVSSISGNTVTTAAGPTVAGYIYPAGTVQMKSKNITVSDGIITTAGKTAATGTQAGSNINIDASTIIVAV